MSILKAGDASTLDIISTACEKKLPHGRGISAASTSTFTPLSDQSIFVKASINGVVREGVIAACLTGLMILVFLGSWRSTIDHRRFDPAFDPDLADRA